MSDDYSKTIWENDITSPEVTFLYPHLLTPKPEKGKFKSAYCSDLLISKEDIKTVRFFKKTLKQFKERVINEVYGGVEPKRSILLPLWTDGDTSEK